MKNIGDIVGSYAINCIKPNETNFNGRRLVNEKTFQKVWKIFVFYPNNFNFVHPDELVGFHKISELLVQNGIMLLVGSVDKGFAENAWKIINEKSGTPNLYIFTDNQHPQSSLAEQLGLEWSDDRLTRVLCIVDENDTIQFISEDDLDIVTSVSRMLSNLKKLSGQI